MSRSGTSGTDAPEDWRNDRLWGGRISSERTRDGRVDIIKAWAQAAGGDVSTRNENLVLVLPPDLPKGMALRELERHAGELGLEVQRGARA